MKLLILSDSHGNVDAMVAIANKECPAGIIHLGDCWRDATELKRRLPQIPMYRVRGNCDSYSWTPGSDDILTWKFEDVTVYMTHGHLHSVKLSLLRLHLAAKEAGAQVALFGHTHRSYYEDHDGVTLMNPGTCGSVMGTYGILEINGGSYKGEIRRLRED